MVQFTYLHAYKKGMITSFMCTFYQKSMFGWYILIKHTPRLYRGWHNGWAKSNFGPKNNIFIGSWCRHIVWPSCLHTDKRYHLSLLQLKCNGRVTIKVPKAGYTRSKMRCLVELHNGFQSIDYGLLHISELFRSTVSCFNWEIPILLSVGLSWNVHYIKAYAILCDCII